jgi:hypothetical protein
VPRSRKQPSSSPRSAYDPLCFIIRARNDNDHSDYIPKTQVTPELHAEVMSLVNSGVFEFDSIAGFVRWALVHGLEFCKHLKPEFPSNISIIRAMELESARQQTRVNFLNHIEQRAKEAFELTGRGLHNQAARHVYNILTEIRKMDPEDEWRGIFESELKKRFGKLLTRGRIVSHIPEKTKTPQPHPDWKNRDEADDTN